MAEQLPLGIRLRDDATFSNFFAGNNMQVVQALRDINEPYLFIFAERGAGKSHLLQALCHEASSQQQSSVYLPLAEPGFVPAMLEGLEALSLVCLDDIDQVVGQDDWEEALFHLYNRIRQQGGRLVIASSRAIHAMPFKLADLKSRLSWGLVFQLQEHDDHDKQNILQLRASNRGLELGDEVASYLLKRYSRDLNHLFELLNVLDRQSLVEQRRLTIPFVKKFV